MIKVRLTSNESNDVCDIIEKRITNGIEIEEWIVLNIQGISFDSMDYPYDMEDCYECYFQSKKEKVKEEEIMKLLDSVALKEIKVGYNVCVIDD